MSATAWESALIDSPIDKVWGCIRTMDFVFNPRVQSARVVDRKPPARPWGVGEIGNVVYVDGTTQAIQLLALSDANHLVSWQVITSEPAVNYTSATHTIRLRRVTTSNATFVEWTTDFSADASPNCVPDASLKQKEALAALRVEAAKTWTWYSTSDDVAKGYDLKGKTFVVTGGNSGIGYDTVRVLASKGAHVVFTARDDKKIAETVAELKKHQSNANVEGMVCALDSLKSIRAFAAAYKAKGFPLHVLINNAGVMACPYSLTENKFEQQIGVNHIGHQLLTTELLPVIKKSAPARIVVLSSGAHRRGDVRLDDMNWTKPGAAYDPWVAYGASKSANILFAKHLHAVLAKEGAKVSVNSLHPGVIHTNLMRHVGVIPTNDSKPVAGAAAATAAAPAAAAPAAAAAAAPAGDKKDSKAPTAAAAALNTPLFVPRIKSIAQGAATTLVAALHPQYATEGGHYLADCNPAPSLAHVNDLKKAADLWAVTEKLIAEAPQ